MASSTAAASWAAATQAYACAKFRPVQDGVIASWAAATQAWYNALRSASHRQSFRMELITNIRSSLRFQWTHRFWTRQTFTICERYEPVYISLNQVVSVVDALTRATLIEQIDPSSLGALREMTLTFPLPAAGSKQQPPGLCGCASNQGPGIPVCKY